jgi:hypothetical protein
VVLNGGDVVAIDGSLGCAPPVGFFAVPPCRIIDTRSAPGPNGGPALVGAAQRIVPVSGVCGIPSTARSVAVNVVVVNPTAGGFLTLFPSATAVPNVSTINYDAGRVRANNAILSLGAAGELTVECNQLSGTVHLVLDVYGYFE